jgi:hypothetical protein
LVTTVELKGITIMRYCAAAVLLLAATSVVVSASAQSVPPGSQAVAKVRMKPLGKQAVLFEVSNFECPAGARSSAGKTKLAAEWRRALGRDVCENLRDGLTKEIVRITYCGGKTVITWTATRKSCGLR